MRTHTTLLSVVAGVLLAGCASADFELGAEPTEDAASDVATLESAVVDDSGAPPTDGCVENGCGGCAPLAMPPGAACGICGTSTYACASPTSTTCSRLDDRTEGTHVLNKAVDSLASSIAPRSAAAIPFKMPRAGSLISISVSLRRVDVTTSGAVGSLRLRVIRGTPSLTPATTDIVAAGSLLTTSIPVSVGTATLTLPTVLPIIETNEPLWIELTNNSDTSRFEVFGSSSGGEPPVLERTTTGYARTSSTNAFLTLALKACW